MGNYENLHKVDLHLVQKLPYRKGPIPQPHKILEILIGTLLGDAYGEKMKKGVTPYFQFKQSFIHANYLYYLYFTLAFLGYSSNNVPLPKKTSDSKGGLHTYLSFRTLAIPELSWIYYLFYVNGVKVISEDLIYYLNGRVLAYWIIDDGSWTGSGILIHCNSFSESNVFLLVKMLNDKFGIKVSVRPKYNSHIIYIYSCKFHI